MIVIERLCLIYKIFNAKYIPIYVCYWFNKFLLIKTAVKI